MGRENDSWLEQECLRKLPVIGFFIANEIFFRYQKNVETEKQKKCADRDSNPGLGVGNA